MGGGRNDVNRAAGGVVMRVTTGFGEQSYHLFYGRKFTHFSRHRKIPPPRIDISTS